MFRKHLFKEPYVRKVMKTLKILMKMFIAAEQWQSTCSTLGPTESKWTQNILSSNLLYIFSLLPFM